MIGVLAVERSYPALGSHLCGMAIEQHSLGDNTVLATFGVVPSGEKSTRTQL
jgi:hypothetical protein